VALSMSTPAGIRPLFEQLAAQFSIAPDAPGQIPRRAGITVSKYLPESYRAAFNFDRPRTPFASIDDT
jgi:hypothetical protein